MSDFRLHKHPLPLTAGGIPQPWATPEPPPEKGTQPPGGT